MRDQPTRPLRPLMISAFLAYTGLVAAALPHVLFDAGPATGAMLEALGGLVMVTGVLYYFHAITVRRIDHLASIGQAQRSAGIASLGVLDIEKVAHTIHPTAASHIRITLARRKITRGICDLLEELLFRSPAKHLEVLICGSLTDMTENSEAALAERLALRTVVEAKERGAAVELRCSKVTLGHDLLILNEQALILIPLESKSPTLLYVNLEPWSPTATRIAEDSQRAWQESQEYHSSSSAASESLHQQGTREV